MSCYRPVKGYHTTDPVTRKTTFVRSTSKLKGWGIRQVVPCGHCDGCRRKKRDDWAIRCTHEAKLYKRNTFLTLTYDDEHLPMYGSLVPAHLDRFLDNLRKHYSRRPFRFFAAGEYGEKFKRPHYHVILFDYWPEDARKAMGSEYYGSAKLDKLWKKGFVSIGDVNYQSAAYIAKYTLKEPLGVKKTDHIEERFDAIGYRLVEIDPEFHKQTRGLGKKWLEKYWTDYYPADYCILLTQNGFVKKEPPLYYDRWLRDKKPEVYTQVKLKRMENEREELTETRLAQIELSKRRNASIMKKGKL